MVCLGVAPFRTALSLFLKMGSAGDKTSALGEVTYLL
jgi:hypothetical protein